MARLPQQCLSNLRQLITAHQLYVQDYDDVLPAWFLPESNGLTTGALPMCYSASETRSCRN